MAASITIAHISDVHLGPLAGFHPRYWNLKRGLGYLNWHRSRRFVHLRGFADAIAADAVAQAPDHFAVTGDLANIGLPAEYDAALSWLAGLGEPERVSVVPGNHDIYTARLHGASCLERWAAYMTSDSFGAEVIEGAIGCGSDKIMDGFPFVRRLGPAAIVGVNSAVPTPPFVASGRVGPEQLAALGAILDRLGGLGLVRVVLIHHPPLAGQAPPRRGLEDSAALGRILDANGAELVLHGHNHRDSLAWRETSRGGVPVVGVASGSAGARDKAKLLARYNLIAIGVEAGRARIEIRTRGFATSDGGVVELARREVSASDLTAATDAPANPAG